MHFITGSDPWLKHFLISSLSHPPKAPSLHATYLQAITPVSTRRQLTVYDGRLSIPAVLSPAAAASLDADPDDTGVTTRNLQGHILAPVSALVCPDMTTTPPTATLVISELRVFSDRRNQIPSGTLLQACHDPDVVNALRANVGRMLASFATVTVLQRADRADLQSLPESEAIFEDLLNDPSLPPAGLLPSEDSFASDIPRGEVVGGGPTPEDQPVLVVSADTPSQSETQQHQSNVNENVPSLEQSAPDPSPPSADQDFDVSFDADAHSTSPVASNEPLEVDPDALPQTQHFEDDFEDDAASVGDKPDKPVSVKNPESKDAEAAIQNPKVASDAQNENIGDAPRQGSLKPSKKPTSDEALKNDKNADNGGKGNEQATSPAKDYPKKAQGDSGESGAVQDDPVIDLEIEHYGKDAKHKKGDIEKNKQTSGKGGENVKKVEICKEVDKLNQESKKDGEKEKASESASPQNTRSVRRRTARIGSAPAKTLITRSRTRSGNTPIVVGCSSKATNRKKQSTRGVSTKKTVVGDSVMKGDAPPQDGEKEGKATASKEEKKDSPKQGIDAEVVEVDDGDLVEEVKTDVDKICCEEKEATRCGVEVEKRGCKRKGDVEKEVEKEVDEGLKKPKNNVMEGAPGCNSKSYIDKLKAEMEELRRFRKRRNCNPIGFALDPDEFLPSLSNGSQSRKPEISFPPPCEPPKEAKSSVELVENREVEVPESAPM